MNKVRIQLTLDPKVYALVSKSKANKSAYFEDLILRDFEERKRSAIVDAVVEKLTSDAVLLTKLKQALSGAPKTASDGIEYVEDWGA